MPALSAILAPNNIATTTGTQTLTNKTIAFGSNTLTDVASTNTSQTLTNKTINGSNNTLTNISLTTAVTGTLPVASGGTGAATLTGILKGNGTSAFSAATAETDYVTPTGSGTLTNKTISGGTFSGVVDQTGSVRGGITAVAALDIDCSAGNFFTKTINGNSTFTFSNAPASRAFAFTLELIHTSGTVTWPAAVVWPGGTAPTLTTGRTHLFTFVTDNNGTTWRGVSNINYTS